MSSKTGGQYHGGFPSGKHRSGELADGWLRDAHQPWQRDLSDRVQGQFLLYTRGAKKSRVQGVRAYWMA